MPISVLPSQEPDRQDRLEKAEEILGVGPPLTISKALDATQGAGDPSEVSNRLNEAKARLAQLNDSVEQARATLQDKREALVEAQKANKGIAAAEQEYERAKRELDTKEQTFEERAEALRQAVEDLEKEHCRAMVRKRAQKAKDLNEQIRAKAEKMRDALEDLRSLNTEIADLTEEARLTRLDGGYDVLRSMVDQVGSRGGLEVPPLFFDALDDGGDRYHNLRSLEEVGEFLENASKA